MGVSGPPQGQLSRPAQLELLLREVPQWLRELGDRRCDMGGRAPVAEVHLRPSWAEARYGRLPGLREADFSCSCLRHSAQSLPVVEQRVTSFGVIS